MIFFNSIEITKSGRLQDLPWRIDGLRDLNVLIGPNGSGKTTIMGSLTDIPKTEWYKKYDTEATYVRRDEFKGPIDFYSLFYKEVVNVKQDVGEYKDPIWAFFDMENSRKSAGERSFQQIMDIKNVKNSIVFIDEMDASMDWGNQVKFFKKVKKLSEENQIFIATHSLIFCALVHDVYDVKRRIWTDYDDIKKTYMPKVKL